MAWAIHVVSARASEDVRTYMPQALCLGTPTKISTVVHLESRFCAASSYALHMHLIAASVSLHPAVRGRVLPGNAAGLRNITMDESMGRLVQDRLTLFAFKSLALPVNAKSMGLTCTSQPMEQNLSINPL